MPCVVLSYRVESDVAHVALVVSVHFDSHVLQETAPSRRSLCRILSVIVPIPTTYHALELLFGEVSVARRQSLFEHLHVKAHSGIRGNESVDQPHGTVSAIYVQ